MRDPISQAEPRARHIVGAQYMQLRMVLDFGPGSGPKLGHCEQDLLPWAQQGELRGSSDNIRVGTS